MKRFLTLLFAMVLSVVCLFGATGCKGDGRPTLYVYTNAGFAPYEYMNKYGEVVGVDVDIMKEVGEVLGYKVVINDIDFDQILVEVQNNKMAVGAAGMTRTDTRDEVALPSIDYAVSVQYVIVPTNLFTDKAEGDLITVSELANINIKAIGVQEGTTGDFLISDAVYGWTDEETQQHVTGDLEGAGIQPMQYENAIIASNDIGTNVGAVVIDKLPAQSICKANPNLKCFQLDNEPENYVIYFNKEATELRNKVNAVLEVMISNGVIDFYTLKHSGGIA